MKKIEDNSCSIPSHFLEHFPKSNFYMLYTISKIRKSRIQSFKPCTIWSWNEEDMAFGRQLHQAEGEFRTNPHASANFAQQPKQERISHQPMRLWCEISSVLPTPHEIFSFEDNAQLGWGVWGRKYSKSFWYCNYIG